MKTGKKKMLSLFLAAVLIVTLTFALSPDAWAASLSVDKATIGTGETVTATYSVSWKENEGGFIGFFNKDADDGHWITYKNLDFNMDTLTLADPHFPVKVEEAGSYEFRLFTDYFGTKKVATVAVKVVQMSYSSISVSPSSVYPGEKIYANYTISGPDTDNTAGWIAIYRKGTVDYLGYQNTGGKSGVYEVTAPDTPGEYYFILYKDYFGSQIIATSSTVTVNKKTETDTGVDSRARFNTVTGEVMISPDPEHVDWKPCTPKTVIHVGDHILTGPDSSCILQLEDMSTFEMKPNSEIVVQTPPGQQSKLGLVLGNVWVNTKKILTNGTMEVEMSHSFCVVKGTTFECEQTADHSTVKVFEGVVQFTATTGGKEVFVGTGEMAVTNSSGLIAKQTFNRTTEGASWGKSGSELTPNNEKVIVLQVNNPLMTVNTVHKEIDPGKGTTPVIVGGRTVLPIRAVVEELGGKVDWLESESKVTLHLGSTTVEMWLGNTTFYVNGVQKTMDVAPQGINGRTMIPVRFAAENLGADVQWENGSQNVYISYIPA